MPKKHNNLLCYSYLTNGSFCTIFCLALLNDKKKDMILIARHLVDSFIKKF